MKIILVAACLNAVLLALVITAFWLGPALTPESESALFTVSLLAAAIAISCFLVGELTGNVSQVDKIWSLAPIAYVWLIAWYGGLGFRLVLMSLLVTIWGFRLSYNFWLKGGYQWQVWRGDEDYRWDVLRQNPAMQPRWKWSMFNLVFISGFQNALILMMCLPALIALQFHDQPMNWLDWLAGILMFAMVFFEGVADWQQWRFQVRKKERKQSGLRNATEPEFLNRGLWSLSRHPNYFAEQGVWITFYLFSVAASGLWLNWSIAGCVLLIALFRGSSTFSEEISAAKYPEYNAYQKTIPRFLPVGRKLFFK